jgi:cytochrome c
MCDRRLLSGGFMLLTLALGTASAQEVTGPGLGVDASPEQIQAWALTILPDGQGLPPGAGTARAGQPIYEQKCLGCHGPEGQNGPSDQLVGGQGTLGSDAPVKTIGSYWPYATTVFDYIRRAMPFTAPQSLTANETYALTAYLFYLNDIIGIDDRMPQIEMPNAGNFYWAYAAAE